MNGHDVVMLMWETVFHLPAFWALIIMIILKAITDELRKK